MPQIRHIGFDGFRNGFDAIRNRDVLLYYPYHTFEHVLELLRQRHSTERAGDQNQYLPRRQAFAHYGCDDSCRL